MLTKQAATRKDLTSGKNAELQHRHFSFIAATIKDLPRGLQNAVAHHFAGACASTNPKFDRSRFLTACGVEE